MVALILHKSETRAAASIRTDTELLFRAYRELLDLCCGEASGTPTLDRLGDRAEDLDDPFYMSELRDLLLLPFSILELRANADAAKMEAILDEFVDLIRKLPFEQEDCGWVFPDGDVAFDVLEEQRQARDLRHVQLHGVTELSPWDFYGLPPLVHAWPRTL